VSETSVAAARRSACRWETPMIPPILIISGMAVGAVIGALVYLVV
jgi:hypothetical protein